MDSASFAKCSTVCRPRALLWLPNVDTKLRQGAVFGLSGCSMKSRAPGAAEQKVMALTPPRAVFLSPTHDLTRGSRRTRTRRLPLQVQADRTCWNFGHSSAMADSLPPQGGCRPRANFRHLRTGVSPLHSAADPGAFAPGDMLGAFIGPANSGRSRRRRPTPDRRPRPLL